MALRMPGPVVLAPDFFYHLKVRVPRDLAKVVRGSHVALPVGDAVKTVKIGEQVVVSLRTRDGREAKVRFAGAYAALQTHWHLVRQAPKPLTHRQVVALAGEAYRGMVGNADAHDPPDFAAAGRAHAEAIAAWATEETEDGETLPALPADVALLFAEMQLPYGPQLMTWRHGGDLRTEFFSMSYRQALEDLFGREADAVCAKHEVKPDDATRLSVLQEIGRASIYGTDRLKQFAEGDFSPDPHATRYPTFENGEKITVSILFERWCKVHKEAKSASTVRRYTPSLNSLATFLKGKDIRKVVQDDIWTWAEHRRDVEKIAAPTVNNNDLVAASSIFSFATRREGKRLRPDNPVVGVSLVEPKTQQTRHPYFRDDEVKTILTLARGVRVEGSNARQAASRRWVPWICAYSGARVQEPCWLRKEHVEYDKATGVWIMTFWRTKTNKPRIVPLHDALIEEGFLDFWRAAPDGFLFVDDGKPRKGVSRTIQEQRASQIAEWIKKGAKLDEGVDPNHGWRHTFITKANGRMNKRVQNAICGHNQKDVQTIIGPRPLRR